MWKNFLMRDLQNRLLILYEEDTLCNVNMKTSPKTHNWCVKLEDTLYKRTSVSLFKDYYLIYYLICKNIISAFKYLKRFTYYILSPSFLMQTM